ncbi:MAG: DUF2189 domain-containing protein [Alphaproteobacteria bacterium]
MTHVVPVFVTPSPRIRQVGIDRPWAWLAAGWRDLVSTPGVSLGYGGAFAAFGLLVTLGAWSAGVPYLILPLAAGFMLVAPILAVGLYDTSRKRGLGLPVDLTGAFSAWRRNPSQIGLMGVVLMLFLLLWIRIATLLFALFFSRDTPSLARLVEQIFLSANGLPFLALGTAFGAALAAAVFAISAISVPMLLDRPVNIFTAIATSITAVRHNLRAMAVWAALIALFTAVGLVTFYIGLVVMLPLIAHASWHAYRDIVVPNDGEAQERDGPAPAYRP